MPFLCCLLIIELYGCETVFPTCIEDNGRLVHAHKTIPTVSSVAFLKYFFILRWRENSYLKNKAREKKCLQKRTQIRPRFQRALTL